ncbi:MAG TPA: hypothetical protein VFO85_16265, partial [Vicinamibacteria bacterium]|nr:hypothetical protein [Vicinamibacteria bacterium]
MVLGTSPAWTQTADELSPASSSRLSELDPASLGSGDLLGPLPALEPGDGRRTLGRFAPNLARNLAGFLDPRNGSALVLGATVSGAATLLDRPAHRYFAQRPRAPEFGALGQQIGSAGIMAPLTLGLFAAGRAPHDTRFRAATYDLG